MLYEKEVKDLSSGVEKLYNPPDLSLTGRCFNRGWDHPRDISSVQFSCSVVSDSLRPHELQHARPPCPSPTPGVHSNSRPLSW